jgi:hypothetical protein
VSQAGGGVSIQRAARAAEESHVKKTTKSSPGIVVKRLHRRFKEPGESLHGFAVRWVTAAETSHGTVCAAKWLAGKGFAAP